MPENNVPTWLALARSYRGQVEIPGASHNPLIVQWWRAIRASFVDDETPWCAAFVGGVMEELGIASSRSAAARSYLQWGQGLDVPALGAIAVFSRPPSPWTGHVGFIDGITPSGDLMVLGGNQRNSVRTDPFSRSRLIGLRWPTGFAHPFPQPLPVMAGGGALSTDEA